MKKKVFLIPLAMFMAAGTVSLASCGEKKPDPTPVVQTLDSISVTKLPTKTVYNVGDTFDPTGLQVTAKYTDGSTKVLVGTDYTLSPTQNLQLGTSKVTVTYEEGGVTKTAEIAITVARPGEKVLTGLYIEKSPNKTEYIEHEDFDPTGMEIHALYSDGSATILNGTDYTISPLHDLAAGTELVTITYEEGGVTKTAEIEIRVVGGEIIPVTGLKYEVAKYSIEIDELLELKVTVEPEDATIKSVTYEYDENVISIEDGFIKGLAAGSTDIIIKSSSNPDISKTIQNFKVVGHSIDLPTSTSKGYEMVESGELTDGDYVQFIVQYGGKIYGMPTYTSGKNNIPGQELSLASDVIDDSTSNGLYVVVKNADNTYSFQDSNGKYLDACGGTEKNYLKVSDTITDTSKFNVSIVGGKAAIVCADAATTRSYFYFNGGSALFSCYGDKTGDESYPLVSLFTKTPEDTPVTSVEFNKESYSLDIGSSITVSARVLPAEATDKEITYSLKDVSPAGCVTLDGAVLTGVAGGTATVVATSHDGGHTAEATVTVENINYGSEAAPLSVTEAMAIINEQCKASGDFTRHEIYCTGLVSVLGEKQSYGYKNTHVSDGTSDVLIYSLNLNAEQLAAYEVGKTVIFHGYATNYSGTIEFSTYNGNVYVTASYVGDPIVHVTGVSLDHESLSLEAGTAAVQLSATVAPEEATNKDVSWSSNNESVATVNSDGYVTPVAEGNAIITVTTADGEKTAECTVEVTPKTKSITNVEILNAPEKTTYYVREALDLTGLKLRVHYDNETSDDVTTGFTTNIEDGASLALTDTSLVVSYGGVAADAITLTINDYADGCHEAVVLAASLPVGTTSDRTVKISGRIMFMPGNNLIIQDGDHAVIVYKNGQSTKEMVIGKKVSMECKVQNYNGAAETEKIANDAVTLSDDVVTYNKGAVASSEQMDAYPQSNIADFSNLIIKSKPALASGADGSFMVAFEDAPEKEYTFFMKKSLYNATMAGVLNSMDVNGKFSVTNAYVSVYNKAAQICSGTESVVTDNTEYVASSVVISKEGEAVTSLNLGAGDAVQLNASVLPAKASQEVEWSVDPAGVVTVENGLVTVVASEDGKATVTATAKGTDVSASVEVNVSLVHEITSIEISGDMKTEYDTNDTDYDVSGLTVTAIYNSDPTDTEDVTDDVDWSFDPAFPAGVVTASQDVEVTATLKGTALTDSITETISVVKAKEYMNLEIPVTGMAGESATSTGYVNANKQITELGIKFGVYGFTGKGHIRGNKTVIVNSSSTENTGNFHMYNIDEISKDIKSITISCDKNDSNYFKGNMSLVYGDEFQGDVTSIPEEGVIAGVVNGDKNEITFDLSKVSFKYFKICSKTAFTNGTLTGTKITLNIEKPEGGIKVDSVELNKKTLTLAPNGTETLEATVGPSYADNKELEWSSDNPDVAVIDQTGKVTAVADGEATITATAKDGSGVSDSCIVTVQSGAVVINPITLSTDGGTSASGATVKIPNGDDTTTDITGAIKCGTGSVFGAMKIKIPKGATKLVFYAAGWKGETVTLSISGLSEDKTIALTADNGITSSSPFTLSTSDMENFYKEIDLGTALEEETTITLTATGGKRFVVWSAGYIA